MDRLKLLSKIALSFQNFNNFNQEMTDILEDIGHFVDISRIYIFLNESSHIINNVFEWCGHDIRPQIHNLQKMSYEHIPSWIDLLTKNGCICANDIKDLPQDIINALAPQEIKSLLVYPLVIEKKINGFIGFDECRCQRTWKKEELELLKTISGIIANAYERKFFQEEMIDSKNDLNNFFETMEDFLIISDFKGKISHCNQSLIERLGYSLSELKEMTISELHPENQREAASEIFAKMVRGETKICPLEVQGKHGQIYSVETRIWFGKWHKQDCIYSISKDITDEQENLKSMVSIFENNPLPMVITTIEKDILIGINSAFLEKTGYTEDELIGNSSGALNFFPEFEKRKIFSEKLFNHEKIKDQEMLLRCKDGRLINGLFSIEEINVQGQKSFLTAIVDVTERTALIKNIKGHCQKLTNIIEGTNLGTWEWDIKTGALKINDQWAKMLGYSLEELKPINIDTWSKLAHPEDLNVSNIILNEHLNGKNESYAYEMRMKHKHGHWVWIQDTGKVTERDNNGQPLKMFGTHADISLKKQAEEALKESEKRFFLALDETKAGLWDFDIINRKVFLSPLWKHILGYEDHEIENSIAGWQSLWHPDDKIKLEKSASDYLNGKSESYEVINRLRHKDGHYRWILTRGGILKDKKGLPTRWIGTNIDITREQEQALELERFFSINLDLLCITDMKGNFIKTNRAWEDILGYSSTELKKCNFLDFIHPGDLSNTFKAMKQLEAGEKVIHFINRYLSINGDYRYIEWRSNPYEGFIYAAARDITERIEYEEKILELSNRDPLTNVYNRRFIYNRAEEIIEEYKRTEKIFSVCILDIDHFKKINDTYGHSVGDFVLKKFTTLRSAGALWRRRIYSDFKSCQ